MPEVGPLQPDVHKTEQDLTRSRTVVLAAQAVQGPPELLGPADLVWFRRSTGIPCQRCASAFDVSQKPIAIACSRSFTSLESILRNVPFSQPLCYRGYVEDPCPDTTEGTGKSGCRLRQLLTALTRTSERCAMSVKERPLSTLAMSHLRVGPDDVEPGLVRRTTLTWLWGVSCWTIVGEMQPKRRRMVWWSASRWRWWIGS